MEDRLIALARGIAAFLSAFAIANLIGRARSGGALDANRWWIDFWPAPAWIGCLVVGALALLLLAWSVSPAMGTPRRAMTIASVALVLLVVAYDVVLYYRLVAGGRIRAGLPVPFSLIVLVILALLLWATTRTPARDLRWIPALAGLIACVIGFPLAQVACFGWTDYRRPADAIVVFGARAYANGTPSDALEDRILTAIQLYQQGLAPRLIFSGGPGDGALTEAQVMKIYAMARGVPESAIVLDDAGVTTDATVRNLPALLGTAKAAKVLAVSHGWHLPRIKLRFQRAGIVAFTVPADERGQPLRSTAYLVLREIPAMWLYYVRAIFR